MKYKVGDKFLIEIEEVYETGLPFSSPDELFKVKGFNSLVFDKNGLDKLEKIDDNHVRAETVSEILTEKYEQGLNDAWELARKIAVNHVDGGYSISELRDIFGIKSITNIICDLTAKEAILKVKEYENKEQEIKVGDVVENSGIEAIVTAVYPKGFNIICKDGSGTIWEKKQCENTGKHIDISSILQEIGKE